MSDATTDPSFRGVIALDGPSGTGKSTVARRLAETLGTRYLDTGAMYRAATLAVLRAGAPVGDTVVVAGVVQNARIEISTDPAAPGITLDDEPVDAEIRAGEVTAAVSVVSAMPAVRAHIIAKQRELIDNGSIVVEGRDIGSVVWPTARPKIYLTASPEARAMRRAGEIEGADIAQVAADIERRDRADSTRAISPLVRAEDAVELDSTDLDIDQVIKSIVDIVTSR